MLKIWQGGGLARGQGFAAPREVSEKFGPSNSPWKQKHNEIPNLSGSQTDRPTATLVVGETYPESQAAVEN